MPKPQSGAAEDLMNVSGVLKCSGVMPLPPLSLVLWPMLLPLLLGIELGMLSRRANIMNAPGYCTADIQEKKITVIEKEWKQGNITQRNRRKKGGLWREPLQNSGAAPGKTKKYNGETIFNFSLTAARSQNVTT